MDTNFIPSLANKMASSSKLASLPVAPFKLYRGFDRSMSPENDGTRTAEDILWATPDPGYAKVYATEGKDPVIVEYTIDRNDAEFASMYDLDYIFEYEIDPHQLIDGFDDFETEKILTYGYDGYRFDWDDGDHEIFAILNRDIILKRRELSETEYEDIETNP